MVSRKINWVSSLQEKNKLAINDLQRRLSEFYQLHTQYYDEIDFTANNWIASEEKGYAEIVRTAQQSNRTCEVGCGNSNILKHHPNLQPFYTGCDFSHELMRRNKALYPQANFSTFSDADILPFEDDSFDFVFSVFVLEHSTNPSKLLNECSRILKSGGKLIILCPDFLSKGRMSSQRAGWSEGTTIQKVKRGKLLDALITFFDNRIRIPYHCGLKKRQASISPQFFVNLTPTVFADRFIPDVDAVYVTFKSEIIDYLKDRFDSVVNSDAVSAYEVNRKLIFISQQKR